MNEGGGLKGVAGALFAQMLSGNASELVIHKREQLVGSNAVAGGCPLEQPGHQFLLRNSHREFR